MNFVLAKEKEQLLLKRSNLIKKKTEISLQIIDLKISKDMGYAYNKGTLKPHIVESVGESKFKQRDQLSKEQQEIELELNHINKRISEINIIGEEYENSGKLLKDILRDIFSKDQFEIIMKELDNRKLGIQPTKVNIGIDNSVNQKQLADKYKVLAKESLDMVINIRKNITQVIDDGMSRFDKGYFLQVISPLNKCIPTISELEKTKRLNHIN